MRRESIEVAQWLYYLVGLEEKPVELPRKHARAVRALWRKLESCINDPILPPIAGPGGELGFQMAWNYDEFYLDIDVSEEGEFEWFFLDRKTGKYKGSDDNRLTDPPNDLIRLLAEHCSDE